MTFRLSSILWTTLTAIFISVIIIFLSATRLASNRIAQAQAGWRGTLGSQEEIMERFPTRDANQAARVLELLSAELGIDIATRAAEGRAHPSAESAKRFGRIKADLGGYLKRQVEQASRTVVFPPEALVEYLAAEEPRLDAVRRQILDGEVPEWELRIDEPLAAPGTNPIGHIELQMLILADAMVKNGRRQREAALETLEASWKLNSALRQDPYIMTQLIAIAVARLQAGALRQIESVPSHWRERLTGQDFRESIFTAMLLESWQWMRIWASPDFQGGPGYIARVASVFARPYTNYCIADLSDDYRQIVTTLAERKVFCDYQLVEDDADLGLQVPSWNLIGAMLEQDIGETLSRLARLELDQELTAEVLLLESAPWEEQLQRSAVCPEDDWIIRAAPDGSVSISFSRDISWPAQTGAILPTRFSIGEATNPGRAPR
jgi:hypothetical protein